MALIKEYVSKYQVSGTYWRINYITTDTLRNIVTFTLNLYIDKDSVCENPLETVLVSEMEFMTNEERTRVFSEYFKNDEPINMYTACYNFAKGFVPLFADAEDDPDEVVKT